MAGFDPAVRRSRETPAVAGGTDGAVPHGELLSDAAGNLYGTTTAGGGSSACEGGCGTVFKLSPDGQGGYTETVLHAFQGGADGSGPQSGLVQDAPGTLYGTTQYGGGAVCPSGCGTVFSVTPTGSETVLHAFQGGMDGAAPACTLVSTPDGDLYGVTTRGGTVAVVVGTPPSTPMSSTARCLTAA